MSPTPAPSFSLNCRSRLAECGYPNETNTGVPVGAALTPINGNLTIRAAGTWQDLEVIGCVEIATSEPVVIRRLKVHPPAAGCSSGNIHHEGAGQITIQDTTSYCTVAKGHGFWISGAVLERVRTYGCENGFEINANVTVRASMISGSEDGPGDPHGDGIQSQGGDNVVIEGNTLLQGAITSAIITNPDLNRGWKIRRNFLGGGAYTLYCPENGKAGWEVTGNRFVAKGQPGGAAYGMSDACGGLTWSGNRYDHNGATVAAA